MTACANLTIIDDANGLCSVLKSIGVDSVSLDVCDRCVREQHGTTPILGAMTPTMRLIVRNVKRINDQLVERERRRNCHCIHLGPVVSRLNCNCRRQHIRSCDRYGTTTLNGCADCPDHFPDDPAAEGEPTPDTRRKLILACGLSPGDVVTMTAAVRELHKRHRGKFKTDVRTFHPDIWKHNPYVQPIADDDPAAERIAMEYPLVHSSNQRPFHFLEGYCQWLADKLGLGELRPTEFKGDVWLSEDERAKPPQVQGRYWLVNAGGKTDFTCKLWPYYQQVVDALRDRVKFVQIGAADPGHLHPPLDGVIDLRGKTTSRELILLVHHAAGVLTPVSYPMHLAAAVPRRSDQPGLRPCVVVAGGREPAHWEQYPGHAFLDTIGRLPCCDRGGCWRSRVVAIDGTEKPDGLCERPSEGPDGVFPECMRMVTAADVVREIERFEGLAEAVTQPHPTAPIACTMSRLRVGVVIGSHNMPSAVLLSVAAIRRFCGPVPVLIADDCSDGFGSSPPADSHFGKLLQIVREFPGVTLQPNVQRIGHAGGDLSAFWKGLQWAAALRLDVLVKLSQRYIPVLGGWTDQLAAELWASGLATLSRECDWHKYHVRTECVGMRVARWTTPEILADLTPRPLSWATEQVIHDVVTRRLDGRIVQWSKMSPARPTPTEFALFRESDPRERYEELASDIGVELGGDFATCDSNQLAGYKVG